MKRIFTLTIALLGMFAMIQNVSALVYNVEVPAGTIEVYIAGDFATDAWAPAARKLTKVDDTHFTIDIPNATAANKYKYLSGPDWIYVEKDAAGAEISDRVYSANDVVAKWALLYNPNVPPRPKTVTISALVPPAVLQLYIVGTFNGWAIPTDSTRMTLVETTAEAKIFSVTFFTEDANKLQYKFAAGPAWDYEQTDANNINFTDPTLNTAEHVVSEFKAYYDPAKVGTITVTATVPAGTQRVWLQGSPLGWNWDNAIEGTKNTDGTFSFTVPNVMSMQYRLYNAPDWDHPEVGEADPTAELPNRTASFEENPNVSITVWGWKTPTALPALNADKYKVYTLGNTIVVEGVTSQVDVFDISGRNIESMKLTGKFSSKALKSGLYIIMVDGATKKVSVK